jgi:L-rhamnose mutarotase
MAKTKVIVTERQNKLAKKLLENNGKISMTKAMKEVGYSDNYAKNSQTLQKTESWHFLMERDLPEESITMGLKDLLEAGHMETMELPPHNTRKDVEDVLKSMNVSNYRISQRDAKSNWFVIYKKPDYTNRNQALEKVIKIRGKFAAEKVELIDGDISSKSTQELFDEIEKMKADNLIRYDLHEQSSKQRGGNTKKAKGDKKKDDNGKA